jgi:hypothetical protein
MLTVKLWIMVQNNHFNLCVRFVNCIVEKEALKGLSLQTDF